MDPVDWRPRECNKAADHVANCALAHDTDIETLKDVDLAGLQQSIGLQVFSDGGFADGVGVAAFVILRIDSAGEGLRSSTVGARGCVIRNARSAFHAEVAGLDLATEFILRLAKL